MMQVNKMAVLAGAGVVVLAGLALIVGPSLLSHATNDAVKAQAVAGSGHVIAVIDAQAVLNSSKAGKSIQDQLATQRDAFQKEFSKMERDLGEEEKKLVAERDKLTPEKFAEKRRAFEEKLMDARRLAQRRRVSLEKASADAYNKLRGRMTEIVAEQAQANGYDIVLTRQNVVLAEKEMDITGQVMDKLNKDFPDVKLDISAAEKAVDTALSSAEKSNTSLAE
ncbi:OmpH family outer membrane protein [Micavibrio aeruginosavorus]|uniref:Outer membrane protein H n=1 Tax=Micavibrio aeruginosavorus EPB TaxID=349215 RepID=M4VHW7_9BACT|nr:OmpH family outer membrane protein [Micavibrio aeruginosavorus]AGH98075.1 Outer membrane protein H precursor [Micavibrio aeruginosavorus EPB]